MKNYEKFWKQIKIDVFFKNYSMEFMIVHNIIIYNIVSHNFLFLFCFLDITHFVGIYE